MGRIAFMFGLFLSVGMLAAADVPKISVDDAIKNIRGDDSKATDAAMDSLRERAKNGLNLAEGLQILNGAIEASKDVTPPNRYSSASNSLLDILCDDPKQDYLNPIAVGFDALPSDAKQTALAIFVALGPGDGLKAYIERLGPTTAAGYRCKNAFGKLKGSDERVLQALLESLKYDGSVGIGVEAMLTYAEKNDLPIGSLETHLPEIALAYERSLRRVKDTRQRLGNDPGLRWNDDYQQVASIAEYFPDLLGHAGPEAEPILRKSFEAGDLRISVFALTSLLSLGKPLPQDSIDKVAADDETRLILFKACEKQGITKQFPAKYATQEALARSEMVRWLIYPTELERAPDEIELMRVVSETNKSGETQDVYLFRFRTKGDYWATKDGWMAGVAGPFIRSDEPTSESQGGTWSSFAKWDSKTPEQHVADARQLIEESWKHQAK